VYYTVSMAMKAKSDTVTVICKPDVGRADDTVPAAIIARNDFLVSNGTGLLVNVAAGYAANGAFVAAQSSVAITNATNYIEVTAAGVVSVNTTAFTAGSYPLATVVASAGAITSNTDLRAWITPKPGAAGGVTSITGTANEITVTGTTTPTLSLPSALTFTGKTVTGGTFTSGAFNGTVGATTPSTVAGTTGNFSTYLRTTGATAELYTLGVDATIYTSGTNAKIYTNGAAASIYTNGITAGIYTQGDNANILTYGTNAYIQTRSTFNLDSGTFTTTLSHAPTANRAIAFPDAAGTLALVSGDLGTPSALVGTNITGTAAGLTAGNVTTNANLTGHVTSVGNATVLGSFTFAELNTAVSDENVAGLAAANTFTAAQTFTPAARTSGSASFFTITTPADTTLTASTESIGLNKTAATRQWATGALTTQREVVFAAPTYGFVGASTLTTAVNVDIADPIAGTNATLTNKFGLQVNNGNVTGSMAFNAGNAVVGTASTSLSLYAVNSAEYVRCYVFGGNHTLECSRIIRNNNTTDATSGTTGGIYTLGGIGVTKAVWIGTTLTVTGNTTLGGGTAIKNIRHGVSGAMVLGVVTVTDTGCTANTRYFFTQFTQGTVTSPSSYWASTRTASTSFVITSNQLTETGTVHWTAIEP